MVTLHFDEAHQYTKVLGYSALGIYLLSLGLFLGSVISTVFHGAFLVLCLTMVLIALLVPPMNPDTCLSVTNKRIRLRRGLFSYKRIHWDAISSVTMYKSFIEVLSRKGVLIELPLYHMNYGTAMKTKQSIKVHAARKRIPIIDTDL